MINIDKIATNPGRYTISSVVDGSETFAILRLISAKKRDVIAITLDDAHLLRLTENLKFFAPELEILDLPAWDSIPYDRISPNPIITSRRLRTLSRLIVKTEKRRIIVTTVNAITQNLLPREALEKSSLLLKVGDFINRDRLSHFLAQNGYTNSSIANEPGEYALRGSIVDIFPPGEEMGFRLDFSGEELESIRTFDAITQISGGKVLELSLIPASEVPLTDSGIKNFRSNYRELFGAVTTSDPLYEAVSAGRKYAGIEQWQPLFYEKMDNIFGYVPDAIITSGYLTNEARIERGRQIKDSFETRKKAREKITKNDVPYNPLPPDMLYIDDKKWDFLTSEKVIFNLTPFSNPEKENISDAGFKSARNYAAAGKQENKSAFDILKSDVANFDKCLIAAMSEGTRSRIKIMLDEYEIPHMDLNSGGDLSKLKKHAIGLAVLAIENGFIAENISIISEQDLLGEKIFRSGKGSRKKTENFMEEASNLSLHEVIVHKEHGIGRFEGLETLNILGKSHDCLKLVYAGGDRLFVPVENIDMISRYGSADANVELDRLGGLAWQHRTARIKKRIQIAAEELLQIAARRALKKAGIFDTAVGSYQEFSARFPYNETEDQERAISDVIADLSSGKPMDRLICGDVGFGKTEVALRAAYIVAHPAVGEESGQVALITPTTLLSRQHYNTFSKRFEGTGLVIRQLSRMVPAKEAKETRELIKEGKVDVVIGTHALLAKTIEFKNLALLIVDEEQKFGVAQKERLKKLKSTTHVLTLTATPIPRTLQLSLTGIRDLSIIATPPVDRLAVRTYVMPFDAVVIREAILREFYRGGRSFYVCPRIKDLEEVEKKLKELVPEVKVVVAHGQMPPTTLDDIMNKFYDGAYDVLLSTTIVESGLDIPTANTLIIHRADMYGLSQLYQLRGRVGRSKLRAYAYLTMPERHAPTEQAVKRLEVMQKLDTLGAGFTLASHDMDIRGFGNLLGEEQSGQVREVGVELYQDMLREAIEALKAEEGEDAQTKNFSPQINIGTSVLIPENYISDLTLRLAIYRRIASLETEAELESIASELIDRFGEIPPEVENLLSVVRLKQICYRLQINKLDVGDKGAVIGFYQDKFKNPEALFKLVMKDANKFKIRADQKLLIHGRKWESLFMRLKELKEILAEIEGITKTI